MHAGGKTDHLTGLIWFFRCFAHVLYVVPSAHSRIPLRDVPDQAQIEERRLKSQQKAAERKKRKELLELRIQQEEQARLDRQKKREERR